MSHNFIFSKNRARISHLHMTDLRLSTKSFSKGTSGNHSFLVLRVGLSLSGLSKSA